MAGTVYRNRPLIPPPAIGVPSSQAEVQGLKAMKEQRSGQVQSSEAQAREWCAQVEELRKANESLDRDLGWAYRTLDSAKVCAPPSFGLRRGLGGCCPVLMCRCRNKVSKTRALEGERMSRPPVAPGVPLASGREPGSQ